MAEPRSWVDAKTILFMAFVCLILLGLDLKQTWRAHEARLREAVTETDNLARSLAQYTQDVFETTDAVLKGLSEADVELSRNAIEVLDLERWMRACISHRRLLHSVALVDEHGKFIASSRPVEDFDKVRTLNYTDRDFFRYHLTHDDNSARVGSPVQDKFDQVTILTLSRRINRPDGSFAGVVTATIALDLFQRFFETFDIGDHGAIALVTGQGKVLVRKPYDPNNVGRNVVQSEFFQKIQDGAAAGSFSFTSLIDGSSRLGSFHRVGGFDLLIMVALDQDEVLTPWRQETKVHLVWLTIVVVFVISLGYRQMVQIRDRVAAQSLARRLQLEAAQRHAAAAERLAYERGLEQQQRELERSNAALEQFAYAASHDLQSPLRAVAHLAEWIDEDVRTTASPETMDNLKLLTGRVSRLQVLVGGLLAYARVGGIDLAAEDVDLVTMVDDLIAVLDPRPNFVIACSGKMSIIHTRRMPLQLILKNLIGNALQHHDRPAGHIDIAMQLLDDMVEIRVSDDGPGIEARYYDEIFVIFKTLKRRDEIEAGGIGLAMVKKQVTDNGGRIWVESAPPARGSTFVFTLKLGPG